MADEALKKWLELSKKFGASVEDLRPVEFFFYAQTENEASDLLVDLHNLGFVLYGVGECKEERWSVIGATPPISVEENNFSVWRDMILALAEKHNSEFDGWGMLIK
jgi:hypothetical protein